MVWKILFLLICTWLWENQWLRTWASTRPYYYGEHLTTNLASNGTDLIISISWRFSWSSQMQPSNEMLYYLCYDGTPCPSGPNYIRFMSQTAYCTTPGTSFDGTPYLPWVGIDSEFYYPLSTIPSNYSFIDMFVMDRDWGLVPIYTTAAYWTALINVMISRRTDTKEFNSSPRSSLTAIVVLYPQCGGWNFTIPTSDPDGDVVRCRWSLPNTECNYCCQQSQIKYPGGYPFSLSDNCELTYTGGLVNSSMTYSVCIQMEDYYQATYANDWANYQAALVAAIGRNETVTPPQPLSTASLQFIVKISPDTTSPCVPVSPLFSDPCTLSCNRSISSLVPMAIVPTSYSNNVNSIVYLSCSNGYYAIPTILSVTCVQTSSPSAQWVVNGMCTSNNSSLLESALSVSSTVAASTNRLLAEATSNTGSLPSWAIGLIVADAVLAALTLGAFLAAGVAVIMWILKRGCFAPAPKADEQMTDVRSQDPKLSNNKRVRQTSPVILQTRSSQYRFN